ncbi:MAG TPA: nuclear transport factor 2 family protein [Pyrinomonadaceae bacterium]|nr:nuclear transport factor 2 family protein [Pyrinomonadaceae bacterium]
MNRLLATALLMIAVFAPVIAQTSNTAEERVKQELASLVGDYADALKRRDATMFARILSDDYTEVSPSGTVDSKMTVLARYKTPTAGSALQAVDVNESEIRIYETTATVTARLTLTGTANGQSVRSSMRATFVCRKQRSQWQFVAGQMTVIRTPAAPTTLSTFKISSAPEVIKGFAWVKLADDAEGDGRVKQSADGKAFFYFFDRAMDMLWFRFDLYNDIDIDAPAVSVAIDTDANQSSGTNWYGANSTFKFEKIVSVGPTQRQGDKYVGYNGITNEKGVLERNWTNEKKEIVTFYFDRESRSYFMGIKRSDIDPSLVKINLIGSVGENALWNDDIGEDKYSTIDLGTTEIKKS